MADQNIDFRLNTQGDTQGAEAVENSLDAVTDAAKRAREEGTATADAATATAAANEAQAESIKRIEEATKALLALKLVEDARRTLSSVREMVPATGDLRDALDAADQSLGSFSGGMQAFIATGNPYIAVAAALASGIGGVAQAYRQMERDIYNADHAQERFKENMVDAATQHRELARSIRADALAEQMKDAEFATRNLAEALRRRNDEARAGRELQDVVASVSGATPADDAVRALTQELAIQEANLQALREKEALLRSELATQLEIVRNREGQEGVPVAEIEAERAKLEQLGVALSNASADLASASLVAITELQAQSTESYATVANEAGAAIRANAQQTIDQIRQIQQEQGGAVGADVRGALDRLVQLLNDAVPDENQIDQIGQAIRIFRGSQDAIRNGIVQSVDAVLASNQEIVASLRSRDAAIVSIRAEMARMNAEFNEKLSQATGF